MAGRFVGCGRPLWLASTGYRSRTRERCRCLSLLWLGPLSLREAVRSDVLGWRSLALLGWASASPFLQSPAEEVALVAVSGAVVVGAPALRAPQKVFAGPPVQAFRS